MNRTINSYLLRIKEFGLCFFFRYHIIGRSKGRRYKQRVILDYIKRDLKRAGIGLNSAGTFVEPEGMQPIWVCWWQGEDQMPPVVKACFESIKEHANGHPVNLITESNLSDYISVPHAIEAKLKSGFITLTHFSDYIRSAIIPKYGGLWIDSTMYITADLPTHFPEVFTLKQKCRDEAFVSDYRWTGFFIGGDGSAYILGKVSAYLSYYWDKNMAFIDYYLIDYVIAALCEIDGKCKEMIDKVSESNPCLHLLQPLLNSKYDSREMNRLASETSYFKLSWKGNYDSCTCDGYETYFGHIIAALHNV